MNNLKEIIQPIADLYGIEIIEGTNKNSIQKENGEVSPIPIDNLLEKIGVTDFLRKNSLVMSEGNKNYLSIHRNTTFLPSLKKIPVFNQRNYSSFSNESLLQAA